MRIVEETGLLLVYMITFSLPNKFPAGIFCLNVYNLHPNLTKWLNIMQLIYQGY